MGTLKFNNVILATESGGVVTLDSAVAGSGADGISSSASGTAITIDSSNNVILAETLEVTKRVQHKGAFMRNSAHQSWVLGG